MRWRIFHMLLLTSFLASGCGREYGNDRSPSSVGGELGEARRLSANEKSKATNICYAFRSKKNSFMADQLGSVFRFQISERDCENKLYEETVDTTLKQILISQPMVFDSGNQKMIYKEVQTHDYGFMLPICEALFQGNDVSNTFDNGLGDKLSVSFRENEGQWVIVETARATLDENGEKKYEIYQKDIFKIEVNNGAPTPQYGMILEIERARVCDGSERTYRYRQIYKP